MSLLDEAMENCIMLDRISRSDGRGGTIYRWEPGAEFSAAIYLENSVSEQLAEAQGVKGIYQVTVNKSVRLDFHDVFKRVSDNKILRVTSKDDNATPESASLNMRVVMAEEYDLT